MTPAYVFQRSGDRHWLRYGKVRTRLFLEWRPRLKRWEVGTYLDGTPHPRKVRLALVEGTFDDAKAVVLAMYQLNQ